MENKMEILDIHKIVSDETVRLPLEYRTNKENAKKLLSLIDTHNLEVKNPNINILRNWVYPNSNEKYSRVKSVENTGELKPTFDLSVNDGNSYVANGIVCHNTTNIPNDASVELVSDIYLEAWKSGCKGMTIYRDGSRSGVLISSEDSSKNKKEETNFGVSHAPKRPKTLECDVIHFTNKGEKWIAFVGLLENRPYEIFTGNLTKIDLPSNIEKGEITKHKGEDGESNYDLYYTNSEGVRTFVCNLKVLFSSDFNDVSRMVSAILRHGMPIGSVINLLTNLNLDGDLINTWKNGVKRILKRYLKDEEIVEVKGKTCANCGSVNIMMIEGCETCAECGSSKCN